MESRPTQLRVNHLDAALGVDCERLVFSWRPAVAQSGCQVRIGRERATGDWWDSGRLETSAPMLAYDGPAIPGSARLWWNVRTWDDAAEPSDWGEPAWFEAPLAADEWHGPWIAMEGLLVPLFRCGFELVGPADAARARWSIACGGLFEARVNGEPAVESLLTPDFTDYTRRCVVTTLDVTERLRTGPNVLALVLGGGWYEHHGYGRRCFRSQLDLLMRDGRRQTFSALPSDWSVRQGPWLAEDIIHGEWVDARLEPVGWDSPGFQADASWHALGRSFGKPPNAAEAPGGLLVGRQAPPIRVHERLRPVGRQRLSPNCAVADFGRNLAGRVRLTGSAPAGTTLTIRLAEAVDGAGRVDPTTNKGARATCGYTWRGDGVESWVPRFSYQGFRYAEVCSPSPLPDHLDLLAEVIHSDCPLRGRFRTSHAGLNTLFDMSIRTIQSNLFGLLTDCPQRDERQGWLADAWAVSPAVLAWLDSAALYRKWMEDMAGVQDATTHLRWSPTAPPSPRYITRPPVARSRHRLPAVIADCPQSDSVYTAGCTIIPWQYYQATGEPGHLQRYYPLVAAHLEAMSRRADFPIVQTSWHGDHAAMGWTLDPPAERTPIDLVAAAVLLHELRIAACMADALRRDADAARWRALAARSCDALRDRFYDRRAGSFGGQAADGMALDLDFAPPDQRPRVLAALVADLHRRGGHLTSGVVCTPCVLRALSDNGHVQEAFHAVTAAGEPGLLWMAEQGWTTLGEHLVSRWPDISRNQPAWALVCEWMLRDLAGIRPLQPGYARVRIDPRLPDGVDWVEASIVTVRGEIGVSCRRRGDGLDVRIDADPAIQVDRAARTGSGPPVGHPNGTKAD